MTITVQRSTITLAMADISITTSRVPRPRHHHPRTHHMPHTSTVATVAKVMLIDGHATLILETPDGHSTIIPLTSHDARTIAFELQRMASEADLITAIEKMPIAGLKRKLGVSS